MIRLVLPTEDYEEQVLDYKASFERDGDSLDGTAGLLNFRTFKEWYEALLDNSCEATVREGLVPATTFLAVDENDRLVGMLDLRHRLNDALEKCGGHIGYSVRKDERRKGYATQMLSLALEECRKMHIMRVLITCNKLNIASARTIMNNGGVLEDEIRTAERITQRDWITLS